MNAGSRTVPVVRAAALAGAIAALASVTSAFAHPTLVRSEPADASVLAAPPRHLRLWFTEAISPELSNVLIVDATGLAVEAVMPAAYGTRGLLAADLPELAPGVYDATWRVIADTDGHVTQGHVIFGVGASSTSTGVGTTGAVDAPDVAEVLLRWAGLFLLVAVVGGLVVLECVVEPAMRAQAADAIAGPSMCGVHRRVVAWTAVVAVLGVLCGGCLLVWQVVALSGSAHPAAAWPLISQTRWGALWLVRQAMLLGIALLTWRLARTQTRPMGIPLPIRLLLTSLAFGLAAAEALAGHTAALPVDVGPAVVANLAHLLAACTWVGGLFALAIGVRPMLGQHSISLRQSTRGLWGRFGRIAAFSAGLLLVSGLAVAARQVESLGQLIETLYGRIILAKIGLLVGMLMLGLASALLVQSSSARRLATLVSLETALGALILLPAGVLGAVPPSRMAQATLVLRVPASISQTIGDLLVVLEVKPNQPGPNMVTLRVADTRRPALAPVDRVLARLSHSGSGANTGWSEARPIGATLYRLMDAGALDEAGEWLAEVRVLRAGLPDTVGAFAWTVGSGPPVATLAYARKE